MNFKTEPFAHQRAAFEATKDSQVSAILWEMGLGKTWLGINTAAHLYLEGKIDALLIVAPNGVHANWTNLEIPRHLPDAIEHLAVTWRSGKMNSRAGQTALAELIKYSNLAILTLNIEAVTRALKCRNYVEKFLAKRRTLFIVDESIILKSPGAGTTKAMIALGRRAPYKRICSGVPITQGPLDLWGQYQFLREGILGFRSFYTFKHAFAEWEEGKNWSTGATYETLVEYKNLDRLLQLCAPYTLRATKEECLDLPPKGYERRPFTLAPEQQQLYNTLRDEYVAELSNQEHVSVAHALTRLLRLQQVTSGYWPASEEGTPCQRCQGEGCSACEDLGYIVRSIPLRPLGKNARLATLLELLAELPDDRKVIIWCRFVRDVDEIHAALGDTNTVRYYGPAPQEERTRAIERFQDGQARYFVGTARAGGRGLTLTAASVVVFYSHDFSYEVRAQAEDRAHRIGQTKSVTYVDLVAEETVDERLLEVVANKRDLAQLFDKGNWL